MIFRRKREHALISLCVVLVVGASCRSEVSSPATNNTAVETIVSSTPPFETREPERYRATRTITSVGANGMTIVSRSSTARDGVMRRYEMELMSKKVILLDVPQGRFVLLPDEKIYADMAGQAIVGVTSDESDTSPEGMLHADSVTSSYQNLGKDTIAGRNANRYRIVVNGSQSTSVSPSETLIWIDGALGMVIRSETKSPDGSHSMMELSDISLAVENGVFQVPADYQKRTIGELMTRLNGGK